MSWRDRIGDGTAEFRGVTLYLERGSISPGRRVQVHEYPLRDDPYVEDLGRKLREWQVIGYLLGEDYDIQRNQLADALELPGAFEMRHSYYDTHRVVITGDPRITESTREGGMARVSFTVVRADDSPRYPTAVADTQQVVASTAESSRLAILDEFIDAFEIVELAVDRVEAVEATILGAISEIEGIVGDVTGTIARLIRTPAELGAAILSSIGQIKNMFGEPGRALGVYSALFGTGEVRSTSFSAPQQTRLETQAQNAAVALIRRGAAVEAAEASAEWQYETRQQAVETLEVIHQGITEQLSGSVPPLPQTTQRLVSLRAAAVQDLRRRGTALPELTRYTPNARMPALVLAHRLYGDARRDTDIIRRNNVRHPGSVPADTLEVLSE
ncbi:Mu-like prophage DNA circulation protein [Vreelandella subterranea]|uniref:Mu-like prophage DNA circulation protein n=1 Tax=Vreelandella subterranea TaxID=416874 RepID=A0A1H9W2N7_9GAMM|nr:DNA circularization N-terminal domain-containing protein [Halomonas subterranea]SES28049.1 Mu-like prophage DNA circulation protein [Halomonas subterranea]